MLPLPWSSWMIEVDKRETTFDQLNLQIQLSIIPPLLSTVEQQYDRYHEDEDAKEEHNHQGLGSNWMPR